MKHTKPILIVMSASMLAAPAMAYVGPGPGLSMISSFFTLIGGIILALAMVLAYPVRLLLKRRKQKKGAPTPSDS